MKEWCGDSPRLTGWNLCNISSSLSLSCPSLSFSALAAGAYRQVPAPLAQRSGAEKLHEYPGESGTERWGLPPLSLALCCLMFLRMLFFLCLFFFGAHETHTHTQRYTDSFMPVTSTRYFLFVSVQIHDTQFTDHISAAPTQMWILYSHKRCNESVRRHRQWGCT